jgi:hypothetical protein
LILNLPILGAEKSDYCQKLQGHSTHQGIVLRTYNSPEKYLTLTPPVFEAKEQTVI